MHVCVSFCQCHPVAQLRELLHQAQWEICVVGEVAWFLDIQGAKVLFLLCLSS